MTKRTAKKTVLVSPLDLPVSFRVTTAFCGQLDNLEVPETDLFVMTHMNHTSYGKGTMAIDKLTGGKVVEAIEGAGFKGKGGEHLVINLGDNPIKNVLLIGVGAQEDVHRTTLCAMYRMIIDEAAKLGAKKVTIPFFPGLLFDVNYRGLLAVLHCRLGERARSGALGELSEIEILSSAQARRHILDGLNVEKQLCPVCRDPHF